jgi:putative transposase
VPCDNLRFGYRFIADEVHRIRHTGSENRVERLCALQHFALSIVKRRRESGRQPGPAVTDDLVQQDLIAERKTGSGQVYACAVKDGCLRRVVGWSIDRRMTAEFAETSLRMAISTSRPSGTVIVHPDRGAQFRSRRDQRTLRVRTGLQESSGRVASAGDNAAMESFFS